MKKAYLGQKLDPTFTKGKGRFPRELFPKGDKSPTVIMADGVGLTEKQITQQMREDQFRPRYNQYNTTSLLSMAIIIGDKRLKKSTRKIALSRLAGFLAYVLERTDVDVIGDNLKRGIAMLAALPEREDHAAHGPKGHPCRANGICRCQRAKPRQG